MGLNWNTNFFTNHDQWKKDSAKNISEINSNISDWFKGIGDKLSGKDVLREQRAYNESLAAQQLEWANTAHQREVADLKAAGLNPWLSASGSGAAVPTISASNLSETSGAKDYVRIMSGLVAAAMMLFMKR